MKMNKQFFLNFAEGSDALRIMPRTMILTFTFLYAGLAWAAWAWFSAADFTVYSQATVTALIAFPGGLLAALGAIIMKIFLEYMRTGTDWKHKADQEVQVEPRCPECHKTYD